MELWIRSQDKEKIFKSDGLMIYCTCKEMPNIASYEICDSFEGSIATYKSKERALEVLDEIQTAIIYCSDDSPEIIEKVKKKLKSFVAMNLKTNSIVYEMPKE